MEVVISQVVSGQTFLNFLLTFDLLIILKHLGSENWLYRVHVFQDLFRSLDFYVKSWLIVSLEKNFHRQLKR